MRLFAAGKTSGTVRVLNRRTTERALIANFPPGARIVDVSFAYVSRVVLGAADDAGGLHVHEIRENHDGKVTYP